MVNMTNISKNATHQNGTKFLVPNIRCVRLPVTVGNDSYCSSNLQKWNSRYSQESLLAMVLIPAIISILWLIFRLWRSWSAIKETQESIYQFQSRVFKSCKSNELKRSESMTSLEFEMVKVEYEIRDGKLGCFDKVIEWFGEKLGMDGFGLKFLAAKSFLLIRIVAYIRIVYETIDILLDCFLLYQLESGQIFDTMVHRNVHVSNSIYAFMWISIIAQLCSCDCLSFGELEVLAKDMKSFFIFLIIGSPELILEYFYMDKFVSRKTEWYLFARSALQLVMTVLSIKAATENAKRCRMMKEKDLQIKMKFCSYMMIPIAFASMFRVIGSTYQYTTGKLNRDCFTFTDGRSKIYQSPFNIGCMRVVDYFIIIMTFTPLGVVLIVFTIIDVWFRFNPNSKTLRKYFFGSVENVDINFLDDEMMTILQRAKEEAAKNEQSAHTIKDSNVNEV